MNYLSYEHKTRSYLHFDPQISSLKAKSVVTDSKKVTEHSFYPFLSFTIKTPKISKDPTTRQIIKKDKKRPIKLEDHLDAAIYSYYGQILSQRYEAKLLSSGVGDSVTAFRKLGTGENNIYFVNEVFCFIQEKQCTAIGLDIEKFFDRLDHQILKEKWKYILGKTRLLFDYFSVFKSLTDFKWVDRDLAFKTLGISRHNLKPIDNNRWRPCNPETFRRCIRGNGLIWRNPEASANRGIPQGAPISALSSNIYMLDFDIALTQEVNAIGGLYRRYCDDIIIVVPPSSTESIIQFASQEIKSLKLKINKDKTTYADFPPNPDHSANERSIIQYLGFDFNGTQTFIRASSLGRYYSKMRKGVSIAKQTQEKHNRIARRQGMLQASLKTRQLYIRYIYLIKRRFKCKKDGGKRQNENFIIYAYRAAEMMRDPEIKRQVRNYPKKLKNAIRSEGQIDGI